MNKDEVREEIAKILWDFKNNAKARDSSFDWVDKILFLKGDDWEIGIIDTKAELPEMKYSNERDRGVSKATQSKMIEKGWRKIIKETK
jgi:hypothetical protein